MKRFAVALLVLVPLLYGCGEPKTVKLGRMHTRSGSGRYYAQGKIMDIGNGVLVLKAGENEYSNLRLRDDTGEYTFHFLPAEHQRQPAVGENVKLLVHGRFVDQTPSGSPTVQVIEKFEFQP